MWDTVNDILEMLPVMNINALSFLLILLFFITGCDSPHPSDDALRRNFEKHEAEFDRLVQMCQEDSEMVRIADNFTWTKQSAAWPRPESDLGFSRDRWDEYRTLFRKVGLDNGLVSNQPDLVVLFASHRGIVPAGSSKGYAYYLKTPITLVDSLDADKPSNGKAFMRLKGNWYLYLEAN